MFFDAPSSVEGSPTIVHHFFGRYENFCGFFSTISKAIQTNWCIASSVNFDLNGVPKLSCWLSKGQSLI